MAHEQPANPPAFPRPYSSHRGEDGEGIPVLHHALPQGGMTLLDYFAGQVMQGLVAGGYHVPPAGPDAEQACDTAVLAELAYGAAADLLLARAARLAPSPERKRDAL